MKPPPFRYFAPDSVEEALELLQEHGWDAKVLAGGQSLIPAMNFRLAQPAVLVDLNRIEELGGIRPQEDGGLRIGAMTRQRTVENSELVADRAPLLHRIMPWIAHPQIRNRGTFGGSLAHADPAAELPAVAVALDATFTIRGPEGEREVPAREFYLGLMTTAMMPGELLVEVDLPPPPPRSGTAFDEVARRHGDYAIVGAAATVRLAEDGTCEEAVVTLLSVGETPVLANGAGERLRGTELDEAAIAEAAEIAAAEDVDPPSDLHATAAFRRHLTRVLVRRTVGAAVADAAP